MTNEKFLQHLYDTAPLLIGIITIENNDFRYIKANRLTLDFFGKPAHEVVNHLASDIGTPREFIDVWIGRSLEAERTDATVFFEYQRTIPNGSIMYFKSSVNYVGTNEAGQKYYAYIAEDITDWKSTQIENERLLAELNSILNATTEVSITSTNLDGIITHYNKGAEKLLGYTAEEVVGKHTPKLFHTRNEVESRKKAETGTEENDKKRFEVFAANKYEPNQFTYVRKDGSIFPVQLVVTNKYDQHGNHIGYQGMATDISKIKAAEKALEESEAKFKALFALSPVAFLLNDPQTNRYLDANNAFLKDIGYTKEEVLAMDSRTFTKGGQEELSKQFDETLNEGGYNGPVEKEFIRKDGSSFVGLFSGVKINGSDGRELIWCVVQNISELKAKEKELRKLAEEVTEKNEELANVNKDLEQFAYVASHDLQEPLRMITGFIERLDKKYSDQLDDTAKKFMGFIVDGAKRMRTIITDILEYSRQSSAEIEYEPVDTEKLVEDIANMHLSTSSAPLVVDYKGLPSIMAHKSGMRQVFANLISNGIKYQPKESQPEIRVTAEDKGTHWLFVVEDNGIGIAPINYDKVFAPFKRLHSREQYAGTGIGLAICQKIVQRLHGRIWIEPSTLGGTSFKFTVKKVVG